MKKVELKNAELEAIVAGNGGQPGEGGGGIGDSPNVDVDVDPV